jgi:glycine oxidase
MKIGIAGTGIMGRILAFTFIREGWDVTLFDQNDQDANDSCSMTAAGLLTPISELDKCPALIYQLGTEAVSYHWPSVLSQLSQLLYFQQTGTLLLTHPRDQAELISCIQHIQSKFTSNHLRNTLIKKMTSEDIKILEPEINTVNEGYFFPEEAHLDTQHIFHSLGKYLLQHCTWHHSVVVESVSPGTIKINNQTYLFDLTFDCRGLGAKTFFPDLRGIRGEMIWVHAPDVTISRPVRLLHPRYSMYCVPRKNHVYLIGATEIESENKKAITVKSTLELLSAAYYLHPGFAEASIIKTTVNHRPTLTNHLPAIKWSHKFIAVNGLYRHGYLIAPTLAQDILQFIKYSFNAVYYPQLWEKLHDSYSF